jgi:hydrogenase maturation protease
VNEGRVLIAGIGNVFLGDDAFGVEVVRRLAARGLPERVRAVDFGIRGFDLACALIDGYDAAILVDAAPRGGSPGTLYVIEADTTAGEASAAVEGHALDPVKVFALARSLGGDLPPVQVVGCEPASLGAEDGDVDVALSPPVAEAVDRAVDLVLELALRATRGADA